MRKLLAALFALLPVSAIANPACRGVTKKQVLQVKRGETVVIILIIEQGINRVDLYVLLLLTIIQFVLILFG